MGRGWWGGVWGFCEHGQLLGDRPQGVPHFLVESSKALSIGCSCLLLPGLCLFRQGCLLGELLIHPGGKPPDAAGLGGRVAFGGWGLEVGSFFDPAPLCSFLLCQLHQPPLFQLLEERFPGPTQPCSFLFGSSCFVQGELVGCFLLR